jgi:hypothetical protein
VLNHARQAFFFFEAEGLPPYIIRKDNFDLPIYTTLFIGSVNTARQ